MISMPRTVLMALVLAVTVTRQGGPLPGWTVQASGVATRLRGVSAVSDRVAWASGAEGTVLRTEDSGTTWRPLTIPGTKKLDFRDVDAVDPRMAFVLSIGPGDQSRIYKTADGGTTWTEQYVNRDPKAFFDAMAFFDGRSGVAFSDSVDGRFVVLTTDDGGRQWTRVPVERLPPALLNEGAFAASGTNVAVHGGDRIWIGTGAASEARVLRSPDRGRTWQIAATPLAAGPSSGIFSIAFKDPRHGIVVGGDYQKEAVAGDNAAVTADGGVTWTPVTGLSGFRSAVAYVPGRAGAIIAVGPSGTDMSADDGRTWRPIPGPGFHAFSVSPTGNLAWGVGEKGAIGLLQLK
jgi:photosystem II stability/assembly factor-like uncharacterized protein